jgi:hypothetical protein
MARKKEPQYFYAAIETPYLSKEDLWDYRPKGVLIVLSDYDISQIKKYMESTVDKDNRNSENMCIKVKYPVEVELVVYQDSDESMFDEDCNYNPSAEGIYISGDYLFFKMCDYNDNWDIAEAEFDLSQLKPMKEWGLGEELEFKNLEN